jgi:hypothetical protein
VDPFVAAPARSPRALGSRRPARHSRHASATATASPAIQRFMRSPNAPRPRRYSSFRASITTAVMLSLPPRWLASATADSAHSSSEPSLHSSATSVSPEK